MCIIWGKCVNVGIIWSPCLCFLCCFLFMWASFTVRVVEGRGKISLQLPAPQCQQSCWAGASVLARLVDWLNCQQNLGSGILGSCWGQVYETWKSKAFLFSFLLWCWRVTYFCCWKWDEFDVRLIGVNQFGPHVLFLPLPYFARKSSLMERFESFSLVAMQTTLCCKSQQSRLQYQFKN